MQGDFEKKVQEKMEALNLTPSAPVWEKIELQIRPEKKRRLLFFWLLLAALLMGGGWWYLAQQDQPETEAARPIHPAASGHQTPAPGETPVVAENPPATGKSQESSGSLITAKAEAKESSIPFNSSSAFVAMHRSVKKDQQVNPVDAGNEPASMQHQRMEETFVPQSHPAEKKEQVAEEKSGAAIETTLADSLQVQPQIPAGNQPQAPSSDSSTKKKVAAVEKEWRKLILLRAGWSEYASALGTIYQPAALYSSPGSLNSGVGGSNGRPPGPFTSGFSFGVGVGVEKQLSKRVRFSAALQYASYRVQTTVGSFQRIDTTVVDANKALDLNGYYNNNTASAYTTRMHLLELPLEFSYQLAAKRPLQFSLGAAYGRLLQSNALTYNPSLNIYYHNKENNNRDYLNLTAGLQYDLLTSGTLKLGLGPQVQYGLLGVQKQPTNQSPHLFFAGVRSVVRF